jgi:hypothetical protein
MTTTIQELMPVEAQVLIAKQDPEQVLHFAKRAADVLMRVYNQKKKKVVMNGRDYLEHSDWSTMGRFFNVTARTKSGSVRYVDLGTAQGWEAEAEAIMIIDGIPVVLSIADAMCLNDEENWGDRAKYEWVDVLDANGQKVWEDNPKEQGKKRVKREKKQISTEPTPQFQLRSMAQTRAQVKVLRQMFSWVLVLAGLSDSFGDTPAEELGREGNNIEDGNGGKSEIKQPQKKEQPKGVAVSEGQRKRMFAIARDAGFNAEERVKQVITAYGFEHADHVTKDVYNDVCAALTNTLWKPADVKPRANAEAAAAPAKDSKPPETFPIECRVESVEQKKDNKGDYVHLKVAGYDIYSRKAEHFPVLAGSAGLDCKFICKTIGEFKLQVLTITKVGDKEWMEDGTPVIRQEPRTPPAAAEGVAAADMGFQPPE